MFPTPAPSYYPNLGPLSPLPVLSLHASYGPPARRTPQLSHHTPIPPTISLSHYISPHLLACPPAPHGRCPQSSTPLFPPTPAIQPFFPLSPPPRSPSTHPPFSRSRPHRSAPRKSSPLRPARSLAPSLPPPVGANPQPCSLAPAAASTSIHPGHSGPGPSSHVPPPPPSPNTEMEPVPTPLTSALPGRPAPSPHARPLPAPPAASPPAPAPGGEGVAPEQGIPACFGTGGAGRGLREMSGECWQPPAPSRLVLCYSLTAAASECIFGQLTPLSPPKLPRSPRGPPTGSPHLGWELRTRRRALSARPSRLLHWLNFG